MKMRVFLPGLLFVFACLPCVRAEEAESAQAAADPWAALEEAVDSYYNLEDAGLRRAACYVRSLEILKKFDATARRIIQSVWFEAVMEPGKPVKVESRRIPAHYGADARAGVEAFRLGAQQVLRGVERGLNAVQIFLDPDKLRHGFDAAFDEKNTNRILLTPKRPARRRRWGRRREEEKDSGQSIAILLDDRGRIKEVEVTKPTGKSVFRVTPRAYGDAWVIAELDVAELDDRDRLNERTLIEIDYTREKKLLLPSKITFKVLDERGRLADRRNEPNPVSITFSKYEVEVKR